LFWNENGPSTINSPNSSVGFHVIQRDVGNSSKSSGNMTPTNLNIKIEGIDNDYFDYYTWLSDNIHE
jgi:hypothetical protein